MSAEILTSIVHYVVKIVLTGGLLFVILLCGLLVFRLWFDQRLVLSPFEHQSASEASTAKGQYFTQLVAEHLRELHAFYTGQATGRVSDDAPLIPSADQAGRGHGFTQMPELQEAPLSIDIEAYGIRVSTLLTDLWRWVERPRTIEGRLWEGSGGYRVTGVLNRGPEGSEVPWILEEADIETASAELACRILHMLLSAPARPAFSKTPSLDFCLFTRAWRAYERYRGRLLDPGTQAEAEAALKDAAALIDLLETRQGRREQRFPFVPKLAALIQLEQGQAAAALASLAEYRRRLDDYGVKDERLDELEQRVAALQVPAPAARTAADALDLRQRVRPLRPGASVATETVSAGTLCCFVHDRAGKRYILSADHALAGEPGAAVLQPAPLDGGTAADRIGFLSTIMRPEPDRSNRAAGAIAELSRDTEFLQDIPGIGPVAGVAEVVRVGEKVRAVGRTSGLIEGEVQGLNATLNIGFGAGDVRRFEGMIVTSPMSAGGDSGAPVVNQRNELVGMIYGGSSVSTIVMPIGPVLEALEVSLALD